MERTRAKTIGLWVGVASLFLAAGLGHAGQPAWNPKTAAKYLDDRESWWMAWPPAARDHGTFCISCHTAVPYALARPALRATLAETAPTPNERRLLENVTERVRRWKDDTPFYTEASGPGKTLQSRGTESVLNALVLANADHAKGASSAGTRSAFGHMWALQNRNGEAKGGWPWLDFGNEPFEAADSAYYGACLAAVAVGLAPESYREEPGVRDAVKRLRDFIRIQGHRQPLIHQLVAVWASRRWPELLEAGEKISIIQAVLGKQETDGGWGLSSMGWTWRGLGARSLVNLWIRSNDTPWEGKSDGYATGLVIFVLRQSGMNRENASLQRGMSWLLRNQDPTAGLWPGYSLVNRRDPSSGTGRFMNDAATAYSVLALTVE